MTMPRRARCFRFSLKVLMVVSIVVAMVCALTSIAALVAAVSSCLAIVAYLSLTETEEPSP